MLADIDIQLIGTIFMVGGSILAGIVIVLYLRKVKSSQNQHLTQQERYIYPSLISAVFSLIVGVSVICMLAPTAPPDVTYNDWIGFSLLPLSCSCFLFVGMMFSYLVNLWGHEKFVKNKK